VLLPEDWLGHNFYEFIEAECQELVGPRDVGLVARLGMQVGGGWSLC
jgi:hypothetical protein